MVVLWLVLGLVAALGVLLVAAARMRRLVPPLELPEGEKLETTPLQRLAWACLGVVVLASVAAGAVIETQGVQTWWDDDAIRLTVTGLFMLGLGGFAFYSVMIGVWSMREDGKLDERDRAIVARSPAGVGGAMLVTLAVWMIGLTETFRPSGGEMPTYFLHLIFWSCMMAHAVASIAGVLIAYRRS